MMDECIKTFDSLERLLQEILTSSLKSEVEEVIFKSGCSAIASDRELVTVILRDKRQVNLFLKIRRPGSMIANLDQIFEVYKREITAYHQILPQMNQFLQQHKSSYNLLDQFPRYYGSGEVADTLYLVFEDIITDTGRTVTKKTDFHSDEQIILAMTQLGKFHAASYCYQKLSKLQLLDQFPIIQEYVYHPDKSVHASFMFQDAFINNMKLMKVVQAAHGHGNETVCSRIKRSCESEELDHLETVGQTLMNRVYTLLTQSSSLLCHGDFHMWNMAFDDGLSGVKFFDLQVPRVSSGASDIVQYLYQVSTPQRRSNHLQDYVRHYCTGFRSVHQELCGEAGAEAGQRICSEDWVLTEVRRFSLFGLMFGINFILPRFVEMEEIFKSCFGTLDDFSQENIENIVTSLEKIGGHELWRIFQIMFDLVREYHDQEIKDD